MVAHSPHILLTLGYPAHQWVFCSPHPLDSTNHTRTNHELILLLRKFVSLGTLLAIIIFTFPESPVSNSQNKSQILVCMGKYHTLVLSHNISRSLLDLHSAYPLNLIDFKRCVSCNFLGNSSFFPFLKIQSQTIKINHRHEYTW